MACQPVFSRGVQLLLTAWLIATSTLARAQDQSITFPAPNGPGAEIWVDMDTTGNLPNAVGTIQRCRQVLDPLTFDVDVVIFNAPVVGGFVFTLAYDSSYVSVNDVDVAPILTAAGLPLCGAPPYWTVVGNLLTVDVGAGGPGALPTGNGVLARITFDVLAPVGQSGFDIIADYAFLFDRTYDGPGPCDITDGAISVDASPGVAQGYMDPTGMVGCWAVTQTDDDGDIGVGNGICDTDSMPGIVECSLRGAIDEANAIPMANRISFRVPDATSACGPPCTIFPLTALPPLTDATGGTEIDGTTHTGMEIDGTIGGLALLSAFRLFSPGNRIEGLTIGGFFAGAGVQIWADGNTVVGCNIGTDWTGMVDNLNNVGVAIGPAGSFNQIGGQAAGDRNLISGNLGQGVLINPMNGATNNNVIEGNWIGLDASGTGALPNGADGVLITASTGGTATNNTVGGTTVASRNVISGNDGTGVAIFWGVAGTSVFGNVVAGNWIGPPAAGAVPLPNAGDGVEITDSPDNVVGGYVTSGGPGDPPGNVIAGNGAHGVHIHDAMATGNLVQGNIIGMFAAAAMPNTFDGVHVDGADNNTIGGTVFQERNLISRNGDDGVDIRNGAAGTLVQGNRIGTNSVGGGPEPNTTHGVYLFQAPGNTVGGATATPGTPPGNQISSNGGSGVSILDDDDVEGANIVRGNLIGLNAAGNVALGNTLGGVVVTDSPDNVIGGPAANDRNVISGNTTDGIRISDASGTVVQRNYIGLDIGGTLARPNTVDGVHIQLGSTGTLVGGQSAGNVISGNGDDGVHIDGVGTDNNDVRTNNIGTNAAGTAAVANTDNGVEVTGGAQLNEVGGTLAGDGNLISGNGDNGVEIADTGTDENRVQDNTMGTDAARAITIANVGDGVEVNNGAQSNVVTGNTIEGSGANGVLFTGVNTDQNEVLTNFIGSLFHPNTGNGVAIMGGAGQNLISLNNIGNNGASGVLLDGADSDLNAVTANTIWSNTLDGVRIDNGAGSNRIGDLGGVAGNDIASNGGDGVSVVAGQWNTILTNSIRDNLGLGIDLGADGVTPNDPGDIDTGPNDLRNYPVLTGAVLDGGVTTVSGTWQGAAGAIIRIQFFTNSECDTSGFGEGESYLGETIVTADGAGNAAFMAALPSAAVGDSVTATATDSTLALINNTSEFSACVEIQAGGTASTDLRLRKDAPATTNIYADFAYTLTASNLGANLASGVTVVDTLPPTVSFVSAVSSQGSCSGTSVIVCNLGTIAAGDSATVTITVSAITGDPLFNTAAVDASELDPSPSNDADTTSTSVIVTGADETRPVTGTWLGQAYPNPFNPSTTIDYALSAAQRVTLVVYDVTGRRLRVLVDEVRGAGTHHAQWDGRDDRGQRVATGVYFYVLKTPTSQMARRMVLIK